jgi:hypothetical protein
VKNKVSPPYKQAEFDILFAQGFSKAGEILDIAVTEGMYSSFQDSTFHFSFKSFQKPQVSLL